MKSLFFVLTAATALAAPKLLCKSDSCCSAFPIPCEAPILESDPAAESSAVTRAPYGRFVEARTASVFAGACHYGGERVSEGRRAALGFQFEGGEFEGVSFAGLEVGALVSASDNLAEEASSRRSVIYLPAEASAEQAAALEAWLLGGHADVLGEVAEVRTVPLSFAWEGERYSLQMGDALVLEGDLMPNRECCKMPFGRWYEPLSGEVNDSIVGCSSTFRASEPALEAEFGRAEQNDAFVGTFGRPAS